MVNIGKAQWVRVTIDGEWRFFKSCPRCCKSLGTLTYKPIFTWDGRSNWPDETDGVFGLTEKRITSANPFGAQSLCIPCRGYHPCTNGLEIEELMAMGAVLLAKWKDRDFCY